MGSRFATVHFLQSSSNEPFCLKATIMTVMLSHPTPPIAHSLARHLSISSSHIWKTVIMILQPLYSYEVAKAVTILDNAPIVFIQYTGLFGHLPPPLLGMATLKPRSWWCGVAAGHLVGLLFWFTHLGSNYSPKDFSVFYSLENQTQSAAMYLACTSSNK